ncbi:mitogen-activated protein kinase kinase kinase 20-related [Anaeramoeba ignava]|uniref:Mitogen-activated protein kinase kinase kinase 20-related n=1 Tax=Anaeramoeba ignava TaxID=1746090 RepID=A0A9Q0R7W7_ANAIG|nr:mitogen-activated protein kinase kinase kinase 20-related [Anaeramoeba ignava]
MNSEKEKEKQTQKELELKRQFKEEEEKQKQKQLEEEKEIEQTMNNLGFTQQEIFQILIIRKKIIPKKIFKQKFKKLFPLKQFTQDPEYLLIDSTFFKEKAKQTKSQIFYEMANKKLSDILKLPQKKTHSIFKQIHFEIIKIHYNMREFGAAPKTIKTLKKENQKEKRQLKTMKEKSMKNQAKKTKKQNKQNTNQNENITESIENIENKIDSQEIKIMKREIKLDARKLKFDIKMKKFDNRNQTTLKDITEKTLANLDNFIFKDKIKTLYRIARVYYKIHFTDLSEKYFLQIIDFIKIQEIRIKLLEQNSIEKMRKEATTKEKFFNYWKEQKRNCSLIYISSKSNHYHVKIRTKLKGNSKQSIQSLLESLQEVEWSKFAYKINHHKSKTLYLFGKLLKQDKEFQKAREKFLQASLLKDSKVYKSTYEIGLIYEEEKKWRLAITTFIKVQRMEPRFAPSYSGIARCNRKIRKYQPEVILNQVLQIEPSNKSANLEIEIYFFNCWKQNKADKESLKKAKKYLKKAANEKDEVWNYYSGLVYLARKKYSLAEIHLSRCISSNAKYYLAKIKYITGMYEQSLAFLHEIRNLFQFEKKNIEEKKRPKVFFLLAQNYTQLGNQIEEKKFNFFQIMINYSQKSQNNKSQPQHFQSELEQFLKTPKNQSKKQTQEDQKTKYQNEAYKYYFEAIRKRTLSESKKQICYIQIGNLYFNRGYVLNSRQIYEKIEDEPLRFFHLGICDFFTKKYGDAYQNFKNSAAKNNNYHALFFCGLVKYLEYKESLKKGMKNLNNLNNENIQNNLNNENIPEDLNNENIQNNLNNENIPEDLKREQQLITNFFENSLHKLNEIRKNTQEINQINIFTDLNKIAKLYQHSFSNDENQNQNQNENQNEIEIENENEIKIEIENEIEIKIEIENEIENENYNYNYRLKMKNYFILKMKSYFNRFLTKIEEFFQFPFHNPANNQLFQLLSYLFLGFIYFERYENESKCKNQDDSRNMEIYWNKSLENCQKCQELAPQEGFIKMLILSLLSQKKKYEEMRKIIKTPKLVFEEYPESNILYGKIYLKCGKFEKAKSYFQKYLIHIQNQKPKNDKMLSYCYYQLGRVYQKRKNIQQATENYNIATKYDKNNYYASFTKQYLVFLKSLDKNVFFTFLEKMKKELQKKIPKKEKAAILYNLGYITFLINKEDSEEYFRESIRLNNKFKKAHVALFLLFQKRTKFANFSLLEEAMHAYFNNEISKANDLCLRFLEKNEPSQKFFLFLASMTKRIEDKIAKLIKAESFSKDEFEKLNFHFLISRLIQVNEIINENTQLYFRNTMKLYHSENFVSIRITYNLAKMHFFTQDFDKAEKLLEFCIPFPLLCPKAKQLKQIISELKTFSIPEDREHLSAGGFAEIFRAKINDEDVAIKEYLVNQGKDSYDSNIRTLDIAFKEIFLLKRLNHERIVKFKSFSILPSNICLVTKFYHSKDLSTFLKQDIKLTIIQKIEISKGIVAGLNYIHSLGIAHGDIKPENIFLENNSQVAIGDFGSSLLQQRNHQLSSGASPFFVSPEVKMGKSPRKCSDIYSLGTVLYWLFHEELESSPNDQIIIKLKALFDSCMKKSQKERPKIRKVATYLNECLEFVKKDK